MVTTEAGLATIAEIEQALQGKQTSSLVTVTTLLGALARKWNTLSLGDLATMVKCDVPLTERVLSTANTLGYKGSGPAIATLPEAFHVLGVERLRTIILSTLLAQHARTDNPAQREMAVMALTNGIIAQVLATQSGSDGEQAFLCGALRNYGHLLLATFYPESFERASSLSRECREEDAAFREIFGVTPYALAERLLAKSKLPQALLTAITAEYKPKNNLRLGPMTAYAIGAQALGALLFDPDIAPDAFREQAKALVQHFAPDADVRTDADLAELLAQQRREFSSYANLGGLGAIAERPLLSISRRIGAKPLYRNPIIPGRRVSAPETPTPAGQRAFRPEALGRVTRGIGADDGLLFLRDPGRDTFSLVKAAGPWAQGVRSSAAFSAEDKHLCGLCVALQQTLLIHDSSAGNIATHLPSWMPRISRPPSFLLMPWGGSAGITHVLLLGWSKPRKVVAPPIATVAALVATG